MEEKVLGKKQRVAGFLPRSFIGQILTIVLLIFLVLGGIAAGFLYLATFSGDWKDARQGIATIFAALFTAVGVTASVIIAYRNGEETRKLESQKQDAELIKSLNDRLHEIVPRRQGDDEGQRVASYYQLAALYKDWDNLAESSELVEKQRANQQRYILKLFFGVVRGKDEQEKVDENLVEESVPVSTRTGWETQTINSIIPDIFPEWSEDNKVSEPAPVFDLEGADLRKLIFSSRDLRKAIFKGAHLEGADLGGAHLEGADLQGAHLEGANLGWAHLEGANLWRAQLEGADLGWAHLEGAYLQWAQLGGADLGGAHLGGADLGGAHLGGADLGLAQLEGVNLGLAHLEGVNLGLAHLEGAYLQEAHLEGANLGLAQLEGANLGWAQLKGAKFHRAGLGETLDKGTETRQRVIDQLAEAKFLHAERLLEADGFYQEFVNEVIVAHFFKKAEKIAHLIGEGHFSMPVPALESVAYSLIPHTPSSLT